MLSTTTPIDWKKDLPDIDSNNPFGLLELFRQCSLDDRRATIKTLNWCSYLTIDYDQIDIDDVWKAWWDWSQSSFPERGLEFLQWSKCVEEIYPELCDMIKVPYFNWEDYNQIIILDAWAHTINTCEEMSIICNRHCLKGEDRAVLLFSSLCCNMGRPEVTEKKGKRYFAFGHAKKAVPAAEEFLESIGCPEKIIKRVTNVIISQSNKGPFNEVNLNRLYNQLFPSTITDLVYLFEAMNNATPGYPRGIPTYANRLYYQAQQLGLHKLPPDRIMKGQHLLDLGLHPSPLFSKVLDKCFDAQMKGLFSTEIGGKAFLLKLEEVKNELYDSQADTK